MLYHFNSPLGDITYDWNGEICHHIWLNKQSDITHQDPVSDWLTAYFQGLDATLPPLATPATPFQGKLRSGLLTIPSGEKRTYGELAKQLNTSAQGLGQALGANHFPILIPCHRVVAASGLGGFAYGSTWKEKLLNFES
ncbi:MAG: methylated-DNA--[protein]-cysteine S-methyltransferase [Ghiorsea sp.]